MNRVCLLACLTLTITPLASLDADSPRVTGAFMALSVADLEASARWYAETFDLETVLRTPEENKSAAIVLEGGGLIVELIGVNGSMPLRTAAPHVSNPMLVHGIVKAGAIVDDLDGLVARLRARGVHIAFGPFPGKKDQRANVIIADVGGNLIQFFGRTVP